MKNLLLLLMFATCVPGLLSAQKASDYSVILEAQGSSFSEGSSSIQFQIIASRSVVEGIVYPRKQASRRGVIARITLSAETDLQGLPKRCRRKRGVAGLIECRLGKIRRNRTKIKRFQIQTDASCDEQITVHGELRKRRGTLDSNSLNDRDELKIQIECQSPPETTGCAPSEQTVGEIHQVSTVEDLLTAVSKANNTGDATILLANGMYALDQGIQITGRNIIVRSASGVRESVVLKGQGLSGSTTHIFWISGDDVTIADMTLREVANHAIQIHGEQDADRTILHNLHVLDTREQMIKGSYGGGEAGNRADGGVIQCSRFEFSAGQGVQSYTGGIDVHYSSGWVVRDNVFHNIKSPDSNLAEHAIHFWSDASGTIVERNTIVNCDRGIGFGLGDRGHTGGVIRNNFITHDASSGDVGIGLENAAGAKVYHNTIVLLNGYPNAIEYRFSGTDATIINNLTNQGITGRDSGAAAFSGNLTSAASSWFVDVTSGDLHLTSQGLGQAGDKGDPLLEQVPLDIDGDVRDSAAPDVGADEQ